MLVRSPNTLFALSLCSAIGKVRFSDAGVRFPELLVARGTRRVLSFRAGCEVPGRENQGESKIETPFC